MLSLLFHKREGTEMITCVDALSSQVYEMSHIMTLMVKFMSFYEVDAQS